MDAQKKETEKLELKGIKTSRNKLEFDSAKVVVEANKDTLFVTKAKFVTIDSSTVSYEVLKEFAAQLKANRLPLYVSLDWVAVNWQFIKKATNPGLNDEQMDLLKAPLIPWVQYLQKLQEQQAKKQ